MRDPAQSLRRLNLAIKFGIELDLASIEREIDQRTALSGKGTADEAFARLSLVFAQSSAREAAEYIAKHRDQLYEHLLKSAIQAFEIELLARGDQIGAANDMLIEASAEGLEEREQQKLRRIIAECETSPNDALSAIPLRHQLICIEGTHGSPPRAENSIPHTWT
jgi:PDZ domain-containing secreted protein